MERTRRLFALAATVMMISSVVGFGAVAGASAANTAGNLALGVSQGADRVTVSVTNSTTGEPVANATVSITSDGNYSAEGETGADGIVSFDAPNETVNATITAGKDGMTATETVTLEGSEGDGPSFTPFGQKVAAYVHGLTAGDGPSGPVGLLVSDFAQENAGPPEHAGPPEDAGSASDEADEDDDAERGPPEDAGPPEHAGPPEDAGPSEEDETEDEEEEESEDEETDDETEDQE